MNRMGDFLRVARGVSARSAPPLEQSFPVLHWEPLGPLPRLSAQVAAIHSWREISLIYKSFL